MNTRETLARDWCQRNQFKFVGANRLGCWYDRPLPDGRPTTCLMPWDLLELAALNPPPPAGTSPEGGSHADR